MWATFKGKEALKQIHLEQPIKRIKITTETVDFPWEVTDTYEPGSCFPHFVCEPRLGAREVTTLSTAHGKSQLYQQLIPLSSQYYL